MIVVTSGTYVYMSADGEQGCVTDASFPAAEVSTIAASDIRDGKQIGGVAGSIESCSTDAETGCITSNLFKAADMSVVLNTNVKSGITIAGVGGNVTAAPANCSSDGQTNCVAVAGYPAANNTNLVASNIKSGVQIGGVTGTKRDIKQCRNAAYLSTYDAAGASNLPLSLAAAGVNFGAGVETLTFFNNHGLVDGYPIRITNPTPANVPGGLTNGTTYYAKVISATAIQFAASAGGAAIDLTSAGTGTHTVSPVGDAVAGIWDTLDDYNFNLAFSPDTSPWGASYVCNETNFSNGANGTTLVPPGTTPTNANNTWTEIWRDDLTGMYLTNILYDGSGTTDWTKAVSLCSGLNSGDGAGQWRLPTQKELMQLYIDGISKRTLAGGDLAALFFWSSSAVSYDQYYAWYVGLAYGDTLNGGYRNNTGNAVLCVR